jgi:hypothetical protein
MVDAPVRETPNRAIEVGVVAAAAIALYVIYRADRVYRRWARELSPLAGPRARAAALKTSYQRKRSGATELAELARDIVEAAERARARS